MAFEVFNGQRGGGRKSRFDGMKIGEIRFFKSKYFSNFKWLALRYMERKGIEFSFEVRDDKSILVQRKK